MCRQPLPQAELPLRQPRPLLRPGGKLLFRHLGQPRTAQVTFFVVRRGIEPTALVEVRGPHGPNGESEGSGLAIDQADAEAPDLLAQHFRLGLGDDAVVRAHEFVEPDQDRLPPAWV